MIARIAALALAILPVLGGVSRITSLAARDTCDGGSDMLLCCSFLASADSPGVAPLLVDLGIVPSSPDGLVGVTCYPLDGSNKGQCAGQPACCVNCSLDGVVAFECTEA